MEKDLMNRTESIKKKNENEDDDWGPELVKKNEDE